MKLKLLFKGDGFDSVAALEILSSVLKEHYTAGVDEVGRGCLAGPVIAAAVILKDSN